MTYPIQRVNSLSLLCIGWLPLIRGATNQQQFIGTLFPAINYGAVHGVTLFQYSTSGHVPVPTLSWHARKDG